MDWSITPRLAPGVEVSEVTDGLVVCQPELDRLHFLNATAGFVLQCCDGTVRAEELPALLAEAFALAVPPIAEVRACLVALMKEGVLEAASAPAPRKRGSRLRRPLT